MAGTMAVAALPAGAEDGRDYKALNASLVRHHVIPRLQRFAAETKALHARVAGFCASPSADGLETLRTRFHAAMDSWMGIQHIGFGPAELLMRQYRVEFWPDPKNITSRHLRELLADAAKAPPDPVAFAKGSVAVQGFPALERLLFADQAALLFTAGDDAARARCTVAGAIAANLEGIADGMAADWTAGPTPFADRLTDPEKSDGRYGDDHEVTLELFKSLLAGVQSVLNRKLRAPLGESIERARPRLAESWRSGASLRNIVANLTALRAFYEGDGGIGFESVLPTDPAGTEVDGEVRRLFNSAIAAARGLNVALDEAVTDPSARARVDALAVILDNLHLVVEKELGAAMGLPMGFNSLDGD